MFILWLRWVWLCVANNVWCLNCLFTDMSLSFPKWKHLKLCFSESLFDVFAKPCNEEHVPFPSCVKRKRNFFTRTQNFGQGAPMPWNPIFRSLGPRRTLLAAKSRKWKAFMGWSGPGLGFPWDLPVLLRPRFSSGSRGARAPLAPTISSKSCSFQAILRENPYFEHILGSGSPLGSKLHWAPWPKSWIHAWDSTVLDQGHDIRYLTEKAPEKL